MHADSRLIAAGDWQARAIGTELRRTAQPPMFATRYAARSSAFVGASRLACPTTLVVHRSNGYGGSKGARVDK